MDSDLPVWRQWIKREQRLLRELALIVSTALVVGLFFLENLDNRLQDFRKDMVVALGTQAAIGAAEFVAAGNMISLTVLARQTAALEPVARVEIRSADGRTLASGGDEVHSLGRPVERPIRIGDGDLVGALLLWPREGELVRQRLESLFVLVVFCLLGLRVAISVIWRRIAGGHIVDEASPDPQQQASDAGLPAVLRVSILNQDFLSARYTPSLMNELLADYRRLLAEVVALYGGRIRQPLGERALVYFQAQASLDVPFNALCAAQLFLQVCRRLGEQRRQDEQPVLEFKVLMTTRVSDTDYSWSCCEAGRPGRVTVAEPELLALDLDARALYGGEQAVNARCDGEQVRLQAVEQLAQRYQQLIAAQAAKLVAV